MTDIIMKNGCPIVTVSVWTYNSSKFVLETLESIKAQTYPNLILQICDDCSTDNTVELCKTWIEENKERFVKTKIIIPEHNTGVSGNANRSWDACETEYLKDIAGDDILMPNCIEDNMNIVKEHPEAVFVFSRVKAFGASEKRIQYTENELFIYDFFNWTPEQQYNQLYNKRNCLPAPTVFSNVSRIREVGLRHDERIPLLEDLPKWINALRLGIAFHFLDKVTVMYRLHEKSLTNEFPINFYRSVRLYGFYYRFLEDLKIDTEKAINDVVDYEISLYKKLKQEKEDEISKFRKSYSYRLGNMLLLPLSRLKNLLNNIAVR